MGYHSEALGRGHPESFLWAFRGFIDEASFRADEHNCRPEIIDNTAALAYACSNGGVTSRAADIATRSKGQVVGSSTESRFLNRPTGMELIHSGQKLLFDPFSSNNDHLLCGKSEPLGTSERIKLPLSF